MKPHPVKSSARRLRLTKSPTFAKADTSLWARGEWPALWLKAPLLSRPAVFAYRLRFSLKEKSSIRVHVSADERYALYLDGVRVGRGPERCDTHAWSFETFDLTLAAGHHVIVARVSVLQDFAPFAQSSIDAGFLFMAHDKRWEKIFTTGFAPWEIREVTGMSFDPCDSLEIRFTGAHEFRDGARFPWGYESGTGEGWKKAPLGQPAYEFEWHGTGVPSNAHRMKPAALPPMLEKRWCKGRVIALLNEAWKENTPFSPSSSAVAAMAGWTRLLGQPNEVTEIRVPARSTRTVFLDLEDYLCAYPELVVSGGRGAEIELNCSEALFENKEGWEKGNRDQLEGKYFRGTPDRWKCDGGARRHLDTLWWRAGRYVLLTIRTADAPLRLHRLSFLETRYPLEMESSWKSAGYPVESVLRPSIRAMQMCSHETYMDCPYYEQLMYTGDTRTEILTTYTMTRDDLLPRKAISLFNSSRRPWGLTQSRYPCRIRQEIPPFSLWWVAMVHDFALWRGDRDFVRAQMPGIREVLEAWESLITPTGLAEAPPGWAFVDWVPKWDIGIPPDGTLGISSVLNWHLVYTLRLVAQMEKWLDEPERASRAQRRGREIAAQVHATFWSKEMGLYADDVDKVHFSEHAQCLALLSGEITGKPAAHLATRLFQTPDLAQTTIYFSHYLFETCRKTGHMAVFWDRLSLWRDLEKNGLKTTVEMPEPTRSDCHAWGAHPLYHFYASVLGIRPANFGFAEVRIDPRLGPLKQVSAALVHPRGEIEVELEAVGKGTRGRIRLPEGVTGKWKNKQLLRPHIWNDVSG